MDSQTVSVLKNTLGTTQFQSVMYVTEKGDRHTLARIVGSFAIRQGAAGGQALLAIVILRDGVLAETLDLSNTAEAYPKRPEDVLWLGTYNGTASTVEATILKVDVKGKRKMRSEDSIVFIALANTSDVADIYGAFKLLWHDMG